MLNPIIPKVKIPAGKMLGEMAQKVQMTAPTVKIPSTDSFVAQPPKKVHSGYKALLKVQGRKLSGVGPSLLHSYSNPARLLPQSHALHVKRQTLKGMAGMK